MKSVQANQEFNILYDGGNAAGQIHRPELLNYDLLSEIQRVQIFPETKVLFKTLPTVMVNSVTTMHAHRIKFYGAWNLVLERLAMFFCLGLYKDF